VDYHFFVKGRFIMPELTLALPDDLYVQLQAKAASKGMPLEGFILEQLAAGAMGSRQPDEEKRRLHEALSSTGLLQPVSSELVATYVSNPSAPRQSPVQVQGKPLSTVIIEQRAGLE
jgi:hypothetical protein